MIKYKLRKGDLIATPDGVALLFKQTRKYWYYIYKGHSARVSKEKLWKAIDLSDKVSVKYSPHMTRRRKKKKDRHLDLHGVKHQDVDEKVRRYLNFIELPTKIITGNSTSMKSLVTKVVEEYGWLCRECWMHPGTLIIDENTDPKHN